MPSNAKAQSSVEFLVILAVGLLLAGVVGYFVFSQKSDVSVRSEIDSAQLSLNDIAKAADDVFVQGPGSKKRIQVFIPESVELSSSGILEKTVFAKLYDNTVSSSSKVVLKGALPSQKGKQFVFANARADYVWIGESKVSLSDYSFFVTMLQNASLSESLEISSESLDVLSVNVSADWNSVNAFLEFEPLSFSLNPSESRTISLDFTSKPLALGQETGRLRIEVSGSNYSEELSLPVMVEVRASKTSVGSLRIIPSVWSVNAKPGDKASKVFKVCNQSSSALESIEFSPSELFSKQLPRSEGGIVWAVFADSDFVYAGMQDGSLLVWMPDLTFFKKLSESSGAIRSIASDSENVFAASSDGKILVFSKANFSLVKELQESQSQILSITVDSSFIYAASADGFLRAWNKGSLEFESQTAVSQESLASLAANSQFVFAGSLDGNVFVLENPDLSFRQVLSQPGSPVNSLALDSYFLYAGTQDGKVLVYDLGDFSLHSIISESFSSVKQLASSPESNFLAIAAADSGLFFYSNPELFQTFSSSARTFMQSVFSFEDLAFFGTDDSSVYAVRYSELVSKLAAYWLEGLQGIDSVSGGSCVDREISLTIPPLISESTFFGEVKVGNEENFDVLQLKAMVE